MVVQKKKVLLLPLILCNPYAFDVMIIEQDHFHYENTLSFYWVNDRICCISSE